MRGQRWLAAPLALALGSGALAETPVIYNGPLTAESLALLCAAGRLDLTGGNDRYYCEGYIRATIDLDPRLGRLRRACRLRVDRIADAIARRQYDRIESISGRPASDLIVSLAPTLCMQPLS